MITEANLSYSASSKPSNEKDPFSIKPRSALPEYQGDEVIVINLNASSGTRTVLIPHSKLLVKLDLKFDNSTSESRKIVDVKMHPNPDLNALYDNLVPPASQKVVFIYPIFTQAAYSKNGFYDYYLQKCDSKCLTVNLPTTFSGGAYASAGGATMLHFLNYQFVTDIDVDKNPSILTKYDKVILLHNEYVTQKEFNAITKHKNVVYLYPNALYALVKSDYKTNTITLQKGHGYPNEKISNGFGWKYDNSKYEYDLQCDNWKFTRVPNGKMLNCNPDYRVFFDKNLLLEIKK
ncbi:MAG: hypothetical protein QXN55_04040 [Candidatus Nitrosotenuis sp.]